MNQYSLCFRLSIIQVDLTKVSKVVRSELGLLKVDKNLLDLLKPI